MDTLSSGVGLGFSLTAIQPSQKHLRTRSSSQKILCFPIQQKFLSYNAYSAGEQHRQKTLISRKGLECRCYAPTEGNASKGDDSGSGPQRKRLAIFVSGGGSNFKSIHVATLDGLIHGDVAVLVTDKPSEFSTLFHDSCTSPKSVRKEDVTVHVNLQYIKLVVLFY